LRGGILEYVAQANTQADTARAQKDRFRPGTYCMQLNNPRHQKQSPHGTVLV